MSYTPVPVIAAGDTIDEVFINTYWVDNMAASVPDVFSAVGQIVVGSGVDEMGILNVGANNTVLVADALAVLGMKWGEVPTPKITFLERSTNQDVSGTGTIPVLWNVETRDDDGLHSLAINTERITFVRSGIYMILACLRLNNPSGNAKFAHIYKNGVEVGFITITGYGGESLMVRLMNVATSDYIDVRLGTTGSASIMPLSYFAAIRLGE